MALEQGPVPSCRGVGSVFELILVLENLIALIHNVVAGGNGPAASPGMHTKAAVSKPNVKT